MPIEAQVHQAWFLAKHPDKLNPMHSKEPYERLSPRSIRSLGQNRNSSFRKRFSGREGILTLMGDPKTQQRPLMLGWAHVAESDTD